MKENNVRIEPLKRNASLETRVSWVLIGRMSLRQFFANVEEADWAVEIMKSTGKPTEVTLCIGPDGDSCDVPPGECAVRLARAGTGSQL